MGYNNFLKSFSMIIITDMMFKINIFFRGNANHFKCKLLPYRITLIVVCDCHSDYILYTVIPRIIFHKLVVIIFNEVMENCYSFSHGNDFQDRCNICPQIKGNCKRCQSITKHIDQYWNLIMLIRDFSHSLFMAMLWIVWIQQSPTHQCAMDLGRWHSPHWTYLRRGTIADNIHFF